MTQPHRTATTPTRRRPRARITPLALLRARDHQRTTPPASPVGCARGGPVTVRHDPRTAAGVRAVARKQHKAVAALAAHMPTTRPTPGARR